VHVRPEAKRSYLVEVERGQVLSAHGLLLGQAALLQLLVSGQEEAHPGASGGRGVLAGQQQANQQARNLVVTQGVAVSGRKKNVIKIKRNFEEISFKL